MIPQSRRFIAPVLALIVTVGSLTAVAQTKSKTSSKSSATKKTSKYHRLPTYYGQLKLKEEQIEEIYSIKDEFGKKIDDLEEELAKLKKEQAEEVKDVLTRTQVTALNKLIAGKSSSSSKSTAKKTSTAKKSTSSKSSSKK